jgi:hypothetical protein
MTDERYKPESQDDEPPLNLRENAERLPLYEELSVVLQNVLAIRYPDADPEDKEAVKKLTSSDTQELVLPKIATRPREKSVADLASPRVEQREQQERQERNVRDALRRVGRRDS